MAEDGEFFVARMDNAQTFQVTGQVSAPAGIDQKRSSETLHALFGRARFDAHAVGVRRELLDRPAFAHIRAGTPGVLEQNVIEPRTLDMNGLRLTVKTAFAENDPITERTVTQLKLRSQLPQEPGLLELWQNAHFPEKGMVGR